MTLDSIYDHIQVYFILHLHIEHKTNNKKKKEVAMCTQVCAGQRVALLRIHISIEKKVSYSFGKL